MSNFAFYSKCGTETIPSLSTKSQYFLCIEDADIVKPIEATQKFTMFTILLLRFL